MTTRYIKWGHTETRPTGAITVVHDGDSLVDPSDPETLRAFWAALPNDLAIGFAKSAPKVAGPWEVCSRGNYSVLMRRRALPDGECAVASVTDGVGLYCIGAKIEPGGMSLAEAQAACDAELRRQGYLLDDSEGGR